MEDITNRFTPVALDKKANPRVKERLIHRSTTQTSADLRDWRNAKDRVTDVFNPSNEDLMDIYEDITNNDGHIRGIIETIKNKIKAKDFLLVDSDGEVDEEETKKIQKAWFLKWVDWIVEARFFWYSLVQLGDIVDDGYPDIALVPRDFVVPQKKAVKKDRDFFLSANSFFYESPQLRDGLIMVESDVFGLFNIATPHAIAKRALFDSGWMYSEIYGIPPRIAKTDISDQIQKDNMVKMMERSGSALWVVIDKEDELEYGDSGSTGSTDVFLTMIKGSNDEVSKALTGGVGMADEKSFVGSVEAQERLLFEFVGSFIRDVRHSTNEELLPRMVKQGIMKDGLKLKVPHEQGLTVLEKKEIIKDLAAFFTFTPETVTREVGIEVEEKIIEGPPESIIPSIESMYLEHFQ